MVDLQGERIINLGIGIGKDYIMSGVGTLARGGIINLGTGIGKLYNVHGFAEKFYHSFSENYDDFQKSSLAE